MKNQSIILFLSGIIIFLVFSCEKEKSICGCGKENPAKNIKWLDSVINYYENDTSKNWDEVNLYMYDYKSSNAFVFETNKTRVYDVPITIFDCAGKVIFICGGLQPPNIDSCNIFSQTASNKKLLWSIKYK